MILIDGLLGTQVRTAHSLAVGRKERIGFGHLIETLDAMDEFTEQFEGMKAVMAAESST
jgi:hypothetical protein